MESFEPFDSWAPTLHLWEMHMQTPQIITCVSRYFLGCCMFVCANNLLTQAHGPKCPSVSPLKVFAFSEQNQGEGCKHGTHTCLTGGMWQTQTPEPLACLEELLSLWREDSLPPVWRWRHSATLAEWSFRGLIFGGAQCTAQCLIPKAPARQNSKCWLVCIVDRQPLVPSGSLPGLRQDPSSSTQTVWDVLQDAASCHFLQAHTCAKSGVLPPCSAWDCLRGPFIAVVY